MTTSSNNTESTPKTETGYSDDVAPTEDAKPELTDVQKMYEDDKPTEDPKPEDKPTEDPKPEDKPTEEDDKPVELSKEDADKVLGELGEGYDRELISKFAMDNKFSKEQMEAYVTFAKDQDTKTVSDYEERASQQKVDWKKELKNDKDFSGENGENFSKSRDQVDKVLENLMPNMKKKLTEGGKMLPPYVMKDILNIYRTMNPKSKLVSGETSTPPKDDKDNHLEYLYE